jgi:hypothetical protein
MSASGIARTSAHRDAPPAVMGAGGASGGVTP